MRENSHRKVPALATHAGLSISWYKSNPALSQKSNSNSFGKI